MKQLILDRYRHLFDLERVRIPDSDDVKLRLQRNEKPNDWPSVFLDQVHAQIPSHILQRYPDPSRFYRNLADFTGLSESNIVLTSGIDEAIRTLMTLYCDRGDTVAVVAPGYAMYLLYPQILGIDVAQIHYQPDVPTGPGRLLAMVPRDAKILFLPNPSQPIENCFSLNDLRMIASECRERGTLFAIDEAYCYFGAPEALPLISEFENVLILRTFSKAFGAAGLRLGYMIGDPEAIAPAKAFRIAHETNSYSLHVADKLLRNFDNVVRPSIDEICAGRDYLRETCRNRGFSAWGNFSNNVFIDVGSPERMTRCVGHLSRYGIAVKSHFPAPLDQHILVTCGPIDMMRQFEAIFAEAAGESGR